MTMRVAIVAPILVRFDAISAASRNTWRMLSSISGWDVTVLTCVNEYADIPAQIVPGVAELLVHPAFLAADVIIYGFGIHHPFFDALLVGNGHARQIVRFHNITPPELLGPEAAAVIARSFAQLHVLEQADRIWADSDENASVLARHGIGVGKTEVLPLVVDWPSTRQLAAKLPAETIQVLFVGRIVPSKGLADLIAAIRPEDGLSLKVVGNLRFSDDAYLSRCKAAAIAANLGGCCEFFGTADSDVLQDLYHRAHILAVPSYHEGFCKPVVEALRSGCVPVGYASSNIPSITGGFGRLVPTGDIGGLARALHEVSVALRTQAPLPLDGGRYSVSAFDAEVQRYIRTFEFDRLRGMTVERTKLLAGRQGATRPEILVLPDSEMRERSRPSLNRLPDMSDWEPGSELTDLMRELRQPVCIHRKSWEYALALHGLSNLGLVRPDSIGLGVGAGTEPPLYYFANKIARMVATDLYDNPDHEGVPAMLVNPRAFAPFAYREENLEVYRMPGDDLRFEDGTFDFAFCLSSIEHFGSRDTQRRSLSEMARVLKPGGVAVVITELILTDHSDREYFRWHEIQEMFLSHSRFRLVGGRPDLSISESLVQNPVDLDNSRHSGRSPHIVLKRGSMLWTSFSMFLERMA